MCIFARMDEHQASARALVEKMIAAANTDATGLARLAGLSPSTLTRFMNNSDVKHTLSARTLAKLSAASGVPVPLTMVEETPDETPHKREIGDRLRLAREALGYGLREFARLHNIDFTKLSHWEKGKHYPDPQFIAVLWERHRINADWIYLGEIAGLRHDLVESLQAALRASRRASTEVDPQPHETP